jgi:hypothetical protein
MTTIWKATLKLTDVQLVEIPEGGEILCAREQHDQICIWYRCNPDARKVGHKVAIVGTGHPSPEDGNYIGTAFLRGGSLVFHVFVAPVQP